MDNKISSRVDERNSSTVQLKKTVQADSAMALTELVEKEPSPRLKVTGAELPLPQTIASNTLSLTSAHIEMSQTQAERSRSEPTVKVPHAIPGILMNIGLAVLPLLTIVDQTNVMRFLVGAQTSQPMVVPFVAGHPLLGTLFWCLLTATSIYGSFCFYRLSDAFAYRSKSSYKWQRALSLVTGYFFNPMLLVSAIFLVSALIILTMTLMFGMASPISIAVNYMLFSLLALPFFTTWYSYRFMRKLTNLYPVTTGASKWLQSRGPALVITLCHALPTILMAFTFAMSLNPAVNHHSDQGRELLSFFIKTALACVYASGIGQAIAFFVLWRVLKQRPALERKAPGK